MNRNCSLWIAIFTLGINSVAQASCQDAFSDREGGLESFQHLYQAAKAELPESDFEYFLGLRRLYIALHSDPQGPADLVLKLPTDSGSLSILVPFEQVKIIGDQDEVNPYRLHLTHLKISLSAEKSIEIPFSYLYQYEKSRAIEGITIPRTFTSSHPESKPISSLTHLNLTGDEVDRSSKEFLERQNSLLWKGTPSPIGVFFQTYRIARSLNSDFAKWDQLFTSASDLEHLERGLELSQAKQVNRVLVYLRRLNAKLEKHPAAQQQIESIQKEFLKQNIEIYHEARGNSKIRPLQDLFVVPVGGAFFLTTPIRETTVDAWTTLNGVKFHVLGAQGTMMENEDAARRVLSVKIEASMSVGQIRLWPIRVLKDEAPPPEFKNDPDEYDHDSSDDD